MEQESSYYKLNREARLAYQKAYYQQNKAQIARKKELEGYLAPEKVRARQDYQRDYYQKNRKRILETKRVKYLARKQADLRGNLQDLRNEGA